MYPRSRGKGTPLGGSNADPETPSFNDSLAASTNANSTQGVNTAAPAPTSSPPSQQQQPSHPQQAVRPRRSPHLPYPSSGYPTSHTGNVTINLGSNRTDASFYPPAASHQLPPPPPAMSAAGSGVPAPYHGGNANTSSVGHNFMQRGATLAYDQTALPPPPPPPPPAVYDGDGSNYYENVDSSPTSPPSFNATGNAAGSYPSFSQHSRTSSVNNNNAVSGIMIGGEHSLVNAGGDYRPPPIYGDVPFAGAPPNAIKTNANSSSTNNNTTSSVNSSFSRVAHPGGGQGGTNNTSASARLPPYAAAANIPSPLQSAGASSSAHRHYESTANSAAVATGGGTATAAAARRPRVPLGLKITVGGNAAVMSNPSSTSPLLSSPLLTAASSPLQGESGKKFRRSQSGNKGLLLTATTSTNHHNSGDSVNTTSSPGNTESDNVMSTSTSRPTVEQAEARYQYLYEEFRKVSRVRTKLAEDAERLKRELATAIEEAQYYRQKTLTSSEEREAILHDYNADVNCLLRLVDALALEVVAAHRWHENGAAPEQQSDVYVPSTPQSAIDLAISRVAKLAPRHSTYFTVAPSLDESANNISAYLNSSMTIPPEALGLVEHLGLHYGMWIPQLSTAASEALGEEEAHNAAGQDMNERSHSTTSALTPVQQQNLLLRDETRDFLRKTHTAIGAYMTSLDYGSVPTGVQRGYAASQHGVHRASNERVPQRKISSVYRGLHLHVDVPRFHGQGALEMPASTADVPLGQGKDSFGSAPSSLGQPYMVQR